MSTTSSDLVLWPALALSGAHGALLIIGAILIYRLSRRLASERNDNVIKLAVAKIKKERYQAQVLENRRQREEQQRLLLETMQQQNNNNNATSPTGQKLFGSRSGNYNNNQQQNGLSPEQLHQIEILLTPPPLSPDTQKILAQEAGATTGLATSRSGSAVLGGGETDGDGADAAASNLVLSSSAFDRFTFAMISMLPIVVVFCCSGMWIGYVMRSENAYWVGSLPLFQFVAILAASMYAK